MVTEMFLLCLVAASVLLICAGFIPERRRPARTALSALSAQTAQPRLAAARRTPSGPSDVERTLAMEISDEVASYVCSTASTRGIKTTTMTTFVERFGAGALALAVAADLDHGDLLRCLLRAELPDRESMLMTASLNGVSCDWYVAA